MVERSGFVFIILAAVTILIGLALYSGSIAGNVGQLTKTLDTVNTTVTLPTAGSSLELTACGQKALSGVVTNATGGAVVPTTNYTFSQAVGSDGYLSAYIDSEGGSYAGQSVNVSCNYEPKGYIADGGGRAIVSLIAIFFAFLIVTAALPDARQWAWDKIRG